MIGIDELAGPLRPTHERADMVDPRHAVQVAGLLGLVSDDQSFLEPTRSIVPGPVTDAAKEGGVHTPRIGVEHQQLGARVRAHLLLE